MLVCLITGASGALNKHPGLPTRGKKALALVRLTGLSTAREFPFLAVFASHFSKACLVE